LSILSDYKRSLKLIEVEELIDLYFYRPLAYVLVKAVYRTPITPNQITIFSIFVGIAAGFCFASGSRPAIVAGAALYVFSVVLDCADGQLARLKKNGTRLGRLLDGTIDYFTGIAVYIGIAIGLKPEIWNSERWWLLMIAAAASNIFHSMAVDYYRTRFINFVQGGAVDGDEDYRSFKEELAGLRAAGKAPIRRGAIGVYLGYLDLQRRMTLRWQMESPFRRVPVVDFAAANRGILRLWTLLGSSTQISLLVLALLVDRFNLYFWAMIVVLNALAAVLYVVQSRIDIRLEAKAQA
jgi:phosphatidylglycerophosphate synthase